MKCIVIMHSFCFNLWLSLFFLLLLMQVHFQFSFFFSFYRNRNFSVRNTLFSNYVLCGKLYSNINLHSPAEFIQLSDSLIFVNMKIHSVLGIVCRLASFFLFFAPVILIGLFPFFTLFQLNLFS